MPDFPCASAIDKAPGDASGEANRLAAAVERQQAVQPARLDRVDHPLQWRFRIAARRRHAASARHRPPRTRSTTAAPPAPLRRRTRGSRRVPSATCRRTSAARVAACACCKVRALVRIRVARQARGGEHEQQALRFGLRARRPQQIVEARDFHGHPGIRAQPGRRGLLHERCGGAVEIDALDRRRAGEQLQVLAQCGDEALLAQRTSRRRRERYRTRASRRLARLHLDHVQAEAAVHEPRQHADLGLAEDLARELRRAVVRGQRAQRRRPSAPLGQLDSVRAASAKPSPALPSWQRTSSSVASARLRSATTSTPGCHREQDVAHAGAFAGRELARRAPRSACGRPPRTAPGRAARDRAACRSPPSRLR